MSEDSSSRQSVEQLTLEFFRDYPDFPFCQTLAENVRSGIVTYPNALTLLGRKILAARENSAAISEQLNNRTIRIGDRLLRIRELSLRQAMLLDDEPLKEVLEFYFKHPYAHGRTRRTRMLPRWLRAFFLNVLVGHACRRGVKLDYNSYFQMLRLL
ncbi:MAG TPA: hypothetical protein PLP42_22940 [Acidobacteriota bacterium]|nr:hypothetical protein [Acidobacteriota bacterium]